jgi:RNA polymerase sigma-B factor
MTRRSKQLVCIFPLPSIQSAMDLRLHHEGSRGRRRPTVHGAVHAGVSRERLIEQYLPLVRAVAREHTRDGVDVDDLEQAGSIGLIKAVDRFDPARGVELGAYARPTVEGEIRRHLRDHGAIVRAPRRLYELNARLRRLRRELPRILGRPATDAELAEAAGASEEDAAAADRLATTLTPLPLEAAEPATPDPYAEAEDRILLTSCISRLRERDRTIVHLSFYAGLSQRQIARALGISQVQVSRSLSRSLERCRRQLAPRENGVANIVVPAQESYTRSHGTGRATG